MNTTSVRLNVWFGLSLLGLWIVLPATLGCGNASVGKGLIPVAGRVTFDGKPLAQGTITFVPVVPGTPSSGEIVNGEYRLTTYQKNDGARPGDYRVAVIAWLEEPQMDSPGKEAIPLKYFNSMQSGLTATVLNPPEPLDFHLKKL